MSVLSNLKNTRSLIEKASIMSTEAINADVGAYMAPAFGSVHSIKVYAEEQSTPHAAILRAKQTFRGVMFGVNSVEGLVLTLPDGSNWGLRRDERSQDLASFSPDQTYFNFSEFQRMNSLATWDPFWGDYYLTGSEPFATVTSAITLRGETIAYVSAMISIKRIGTVLSRNSQDHVPQALDNEDVTRFILTGDLEVMAYSSPQNQLQEHNLFKDIKEFGDPILARLEESERQPFSPRAEKKGVSLHLVYLDDDIYVLVLQRNVAPDGEVYFVGEYQLANSRYDEFSRLINSVFAGIVIVFLSALVAVFFARRLSKPLKGIATQAEKFGALEFEHLTPLPKSHIHEVDQITSAMNAGASGLRAMSRYIPKSLYFQLMEMGIDRAAKAKEAELTILITDIVGFTSFSEHRSAGEIADLLNEHFKLLVSAVETHQGTVDKFMGDGMLAFWGAPHEQSDHAQRAIAAAQDMVAVIEAANKAMPENAFSVRIAIHTGRVVVGNVGAVERWNYTVVGDAVNVCSRLQNLRENKPASNGACVVLSGETVESAGQTDNLTCHGSFEVRGRKGKVEVWQLDPVQPDDHDFPDLMVRQ